MPSEWKHWTHIINIAPLFDSSTICVYLCDINTLFTFKTPEKTQQIIQARLRIVIHETRRIQMQ